MTEGLATDYTEEVGVLSFNIVLQCFRFRICFVSFRGFRGQIFCLWSNSNGVRVLHGRIIQWGLAVFCWFFGATFKIQH
jgi:hypothetical protein